ncbi:MAG: HAMP domain-containing sensor histidine kinase [Pseudomonadota bacterium]
MKFTILKRLTFGYLAIMLLVLFMGGGVTLKLNQLNRITGEINSVDNVTIRTSEHLIDALISQAGFGKKFLISHDWDFYKQFWDITIYIQQDFETLRPLMREPQKADFLDPAEKLYARYLSIFKEETERIDQSQVNLTQAYQKEKDRITDDIHLLFERAIKSAKLDQDHKMGESSRITAHILKITTITAVLIFLTGFLISFLNTRQINRSILLLQERTKEIAQGKFEKISNITSPPEIKELADDFNRMCDRLRELDEMKIDFISHVSHELRTPLTAIREASSMLLEGTYARFPEKQHELLTITKEECERLIESVTRILDLSRMEAKMMTYHFSESCLATVIQKVAAKLTPIAQRKNVALKLDISEDLPLVRMDAPRIHQVLENLLGNAFKFTSSEDSIIISAAVQKESGRYVVVSVFDSGRGLAKENLDKIFDKFHRIEDGRETVRGTGLGLPIAKHIVAAHGGKIWAESEVGQWCAFFFTLPVA